jgi:hypothetical protein
MEVVLRNGAIVIPAGKNAEGMKRAAADIVAAVDPGASFDGGSHKMDEVNRGRAGMTGLAVPPDEGFTAVARQSS